MSRLRPADPQWLRTGLFVLTGVFQVVAGALAAYVSYVLVPAARESLAVGNAAIGQSVQMAIVPAGLALATYLFVRRVGRPSLGPRDVGYLLAVSFVCHYLGYWGVGYFVPTPGGALPVHGGFVAWALFERSPYLPWAWSSFLKPGIDGLVAALAGVGAWMLFEEKTG